jgi:hypothetical protein
MDLNFPAKKTYQNIALSYFVPFMSYFVEGIPSPSSSTLPLPPSLPPPTLSAGPYRSPPLTHPPSLFDSFPFLLLTLNQGPHPKKEGETEEEGGEQALRRTCSALSSIIVVLSTSFLEEMV